MNSTLQTLLSFALTGVVISAVAENTKLFLTKAGHRTLYVVGLSVVGGLIVYYGHLIPENIIVTIVGVWAAANSAYLAIVQFLPNITTPPAPQAVQASAAPTVAAANTIGSPTA